MKRAALWLAGLALAASVSATDISRSKIHAGPAGAWDDVSVSAIAGVGGAALSVVSYRDTPAKILAFSSAGTDAITFNTQMPHGWDQTTSVRPHLHWTVLVAPAAECVVRWTGQYAWANHSTDLPANAGWTPFTVDVTVTPGQEFDHLKTSLGTVAPPATPGTSSVLVVHLIRDGASAADTCTTGGPSNVGLLSLDTHYQSSTFGSVPEF